MFRDQKQIGEVCRALLRSVDQASLWSSITHRPLDEALKHERANGGTLSAGEWLALRVALGLWRGHGGPTISELIAYGGPLAASVCDLLFAINEGETSIDSWIDDADATQPTFGGVA